MKSRYATISAHQSHLALQASVIQFSSGVRSCPKAGCGRSARPLSELDVITTLYFPELKAEVDAYLGQCRAKRIDVSAFPSEVGKLDAPLTTTHQVGPGMTRTEFEAARDRLSAAARKLTIQIMGVDQ